MLPARVAGASVGAQAYANHRRLLGRGPTAPTLATVQNLNLANASSHLHEVTPIPQQDGDRVRFNLGPFHSKMGMQRFTKQNLLSLDGT